MARLTTPLYALDVASDFPSPPGGTPDSFAAAITSPPLAVDALGTPCSAGACVVHNLSLTGADEYDLQAAILVSNMGGTEVVKVTASLSIPAGTATGTLDWSGGSATAVAGSDLAWDGTNVNSTAGGVFVATPSVKGAGA